MIGKVIETELYEDIPDEENPYGRYVSLKKTETKDFIYYTIETGSNDDGRSKSRIQIDCEELIALIRLIKEMMEGKK